MEMAADQSRRCTAATTCNRSPDESFAALDCGRSGIVGSSAHALLRRSRGGLDLAVLGPPGLPGSVQRQRHPIATAVPGGRPG